MGYIVFEDFADKSEWFLAHDLQDQIILFEDENPANFSFYNSGSVMGVKLLSRAYQDLNFFEKKYDDVVYAKLLDNFDTWVQYPILRFVYKAKLNPEFKYLYNTVKEFFLSIQLEFDGKILGEWYLPVKPTGCNWSYLDIDISRVFKPGHAFAFDTVRFKLIRNPGNSIIHFGALILSEEEPAHDVSVALADLLHCRYNKKIWSLAKQAEQGDDHIVINSSVDLYEGIAIAIGDLEDVFELHVVSSIQNTEEGIKVFFTSEFDKEQLYYSWDANTDVYFVVPAVWFDLEDSEAIFPVLYIYAESPVPEEEFGLVTERRDSYRVLEGEDDVCEVAVTSEKGLEAVRVNVTINLFSPTREFSEPIYKFVRSVLTDQQLLWVAGQYTQFDITSYESDTGLEDPLLPKNTLRISLVMFERVYKRKYQKFPLFNDLNVNLGIHVMQDVYYGL